MKLLAKYFLVGVVCAAVVQSLLAILVPIGCLSIDEVTYHGMLRGLSHGSLAIENGYRELPFSELEWEYARVVGHDVVAQYPHGMPIFALPAYALFGLRGVVLLNTCAFFGTALVTHGLALRLFGKRSLAILASLIFMIGTYSWEYSLSIWPHALTTFLTTSALALVIRAEDRTGIRRALHLLATGVLAGIAITTRLDAAFAVPGLLVVPAFFGKTRSPSRSLQSSALVALGLIPALAFLSLTNHAKFQTWQPFSYGPWNAAGGNAGGMTAYAPLAAVAVVGLLAAHLVVPRMASLSRRTWIAVALALVAGLAVVPAARHALLRTLDGAWYLLLDLRHGEVDPNAAAVGQSPNGALMYIGALKKSLLQSLPWLPLAIFGTVARGPSRRKRFALVVTILAYAAPFCFFSWHGGLCLNLRYFLPILPLASILASYAIVRVLRHEPALVRRFAQADAWVLGVAAVLFMVETVAVRPFSIATHEHFYLDGSLVLVLLLSVAIGVRRRAPTLVLALGTFAFVWAGVVEFTYDVPAIAKARAHNLRVADVARRWIHDGALVIAEYPDPVSALQDDGVLVADGHRDHFEGALPLAAAAQGRGKETFVVVLTDTYRTKFSHHATKLTEVDGFVVGRINPN